MKITNQLFALFVAQQGFSASAFAPRTTVVRTTATASTTKVHYQINESEQFQQEQLVTPEPVAVPAATTKTAPNALEFEILKDFYSDAPEFEQFKDYYSKHVDEEYAAVKTTTAAATTKTQSAPQEKSTMKVGGAKKFDLEAAHKARPSRNIGAVQGAFKSLAQGSASVVKNVQGGESLKLWNIANSQIDRVSVMLHNEIGTPLSANVEIWQGPDTAPMKLQIASDDGKMYPFSAVLETPGKHNSVAVRNMSPMEFPMGACVVADIEDIKAGGNKQAGQGAVVQTLADLGAKYVIHGEDEVESFQFATTVESIQVLLSTPDARPLHARIELIQGVNDNKQVIDIFSENGAAQPFFAVLDTPSSEFNLSAGATIRVINTAPSTVFPLTAIVEPYMVSETYVPPVTPKTQVDRSKDLFFLTADDDDEEQQIEQLV